MERELLATLLGDGRFEDAADLIARYTVPEVISLTEDRIGHDLSPDGLEFLRGAFMPCGPRVMIDVDAAYAFYGNARAALLLYVGQSETAGMPLSDSGAAPLPGVRWFSVASLNGESSWAQTTHRRIVLDVAPGKPVTWQILGAIIGGSATVAVPGAHRLAITPDGTKAFVTSPSSGTVTPIVLGRPGYSVDRHRTVDDLEASPVAVGGSPDALAADDRHAVVATGAEIALLSVTDHRLLRRLPLPDGVARCVALEPDGSHALVGTSAGRVLRIALDTGEATAVPTAGSVDALAVLPDGTAVFAADEEARTVQRVGLPALTVEASIALDAPPRVVRAAPDGQIWVLCRPVAPEPGRLVRIDPIAGAVAADYALPFPGPSDLAIVPVAGQSSATVRTAWIVYDGGRYSQFNIGGRFTGQVHSIHHATLGQDGDAGGGVAVNDYGEIWLTQPALERVWKWPGGRLCCRAGKDRPGDGMFFGEYCDVAVYGGRGLPLDEAPQPLG